MKIIASNYIRDVYTTLYFDIHNLSCNNVVNRIFILPTYYRHKFLSYKDNKYNFFYK